MATSIERILKKRKWGGADAGKLLVASAAYDMKHGKDPDYAPLCTQEEHDKMVDGFQTEKDRLIYDCYASIYDSFLDTYHRGQALYQQFFHVYYRYANTLIMCRQADDVLQQASRLPLLMTQRQYDRVREQTRQRLSVNTERYITLVTRTINHFYRHPDKAPESIYRAFQDAMKTPADNQRLLKVYNVATGNGYYTLPDGRRSDEMELDEWRDIITTPYRSTGEELKQAQKLGFFKVYEMFFKGIDGVRATYKEMYGEDTTELDAYDEARIMDALADMAGDVGQEDMARRAVGVVPALPLQGLLRRIADKLEYLTPVWHYYTDPPEGLTKFDFLEDAFCLWYNGILGGLAIGDMEECEYDLNEFRRDYPELYKAVTEYVEEHIPALKNTPPSQIWDASVSWGELAELDFLDFKEILSPSELNILETVAENAPADKRILMDRLVYNSIAIVQNPRPHQLDENGDFVEQLDSVILKTTDIYRAAEKERRTGEFETLRNTLMYPALRYLCSFNVLMGILSKIYDIDELDTVQLQTDYIKDKLDAFNSVLYLFYADVYGEKEEVDRKRNLMKEIFVPVDMADFMPKQEAIDAVTTALATLDFSVETMQKLKKLDVYIRMLSGEGA